MNDNKNIVLITGASSGIGLACAAHLHDRGYKVYGTSRKGEIPGAAFESVKMDVDSDDSVSGCIGKLIEKEGKIDVVINCAGFGITGAVEDTSIEEARAQFETNFFGVIRVCRAALPGMRERGAGLIVNISSLGGLISAPFHGAYCASKFAVEGMTEALRMEVMRFGIKVALIEPGDFKTKFTGNRKKTEASRTNPAYKTRFENSLKAMERAEQNGPGPAAIAKLIEKIIKTPNPKLRYVAAPGAQPLAPLVKRLLPWSVCEKIFMRHFGV